MSKSVHSFDPHAVSRTGVPDGSPVRGREGLPFVGMLASPCGVWVRLDRFRSGAVYARLCCGASMRGIFGTVL